MVYTNRDRCSCRLPNPLVVFSCGLGGNCPFGTPSIPLLLQGDDLNPAMSYPHASCTMWWPAHVNGSLSCYRTTGAC